MSTSQPSTSTNPPSTSSKSTSTITLPPSSSIPLTPFCVYGRIFASPSPSIPPIPDLLRAHYTLLTHLSHSEPGILHYSISQDDIDPSIFHFYEKYSGREAFERHNETEGVRKLLESGWVGGVEAKILRPLGEEGEGGR